MPPAVNGDMPNIPNLAAKSPLPIDNPSNPSLIEFIALLNAPALLPADIKAPLNEESFDIDIPVRSAIRPISLPKLAISLTILPAITVVIIFFSLLKDFSILPRLPRACLLSTPNLNTHSWKIPAAITSSSFYYKRYSRYVILPKLPHTSQIGLQFRK